MDFAMSSHERLRAAIRMLHDAGYPDASEGNRQAGGPEHVLTVNTSDAEAGRLIEWIVAGADPGSRQL
jgi:hypothetical protein